MKIELTLKADYLPSWKVWQGIRELIQNGKDAETEYMSKLEVRHRAPDVLVIENEGCTLPHEALLFGYTTKVGRSDMIGKFGEGLKLGVLALVRAGHAVKIRSGSEVWSPKIERSDKFNADVLTFHIEKGRADKDRVQIEIEGITPADWKEYRAKFLFLGKVDSDNSVHTPNGVLLLDPKHKGQIFVRGIHVETDPKLMYGYNLDGQVDLDRDRKMVSRWDLDWRLGYIWKEAMYARADVIAKFAKLLDDNAADISGFTSNMAQALPQDAVTHIEKEFVTRHGKNAVPVENIAQSREVEHLGKVGVVVDKKPQLAVLQRVHGDVDKIKENLANEVTRVYSWHELTTEQKESLTEAVDLVSKVSALDLSVITVVDFRSMALLGQFKDGEIKISASVLNDRDETLATIVHEQAHKNGGDGDKGHVAEMERIWTKIVAHLRQNIAK